VDSTSGLDSVFSTCFVSGIVSCFGLAGTTSAFVVFGFVSGSDAGLVSFISGFISGTSCLLISLLV